MHPLVEIAIEPKRRQDRAALHAAMQALVSNDLSLAVCVDPESGQTVLSGASEDQLASAVAALSARCDFNVGAPQVAYRETLSQAATIDHTYKRQLDASGRVARVVLMFEPCKAGAGFSFEYATDDVPADLACGVLKGLAAVRLAGLVAGFPVTDFKASLIGGAWHNLDSTEQDFELAARTAFRELRTKGAPILLEPIMQVEVLTPDEHIADVIGDLNSRRGQIMRAETKSDAQLVTALTPLANLFGYSSQLDRITHGAGRFEMRYAHYDQMPTFEPPDATFPPAVGMRA